MDETEQFYYGKYINMVINKFEEEIISGEKVQTIFKYSSIMGEQIKEINRCKERIYINYIAK